MMKRTITLLPGDGIGPEVVNAARECVEATGLQVSWDGVFVDGKKPETIKKAIASIKKNKLALKGPITTPVGKGFRSINVYLRQALDLYVGLRPCKTYKGVQTRFDKVDLVIVRENTEDLYAGIEFKKGDKVIPKISKLIRKDAGVNELLILLFSMQGSIKGRVLLPYIKPIL
jgi:isocitrate dehydrogenase (NAD+)